MLDPFDVGRAHRLAPRPGGVEWICRVDREVFATIDPAPTPLGDALAALAAAVQARLAPPIPLWILIGRFTLWRLVAPAARAG